MPWQLEVGRQLTLGVLLSSWVEHQQLKVVYAVPLRVAATIKAAATPFRHGNCSRANIAGLQTVIVCVV